MEPREGNGKPPADVNGKAQNGTLPRDIGDGAKPALRVVGPSDRRAPSEPCDVPAERALLGGLLWAGQNAPETVRAGAALDLLPSGEPFYVRANGYIYEAAVECFKDKVEHDPTQVLTKLVSKGRDRTAGGLQALQQLVVEASTVSERQVRAYAGSVRSAWARRSIILEARRLAEDARDMKQPLSDLLDRSRTVTTALAERAAVTAQTVSLRQSLEQFYRTLESGAGEVFATGFRDLDDALNGGLRPGEVTVLAARTSVGKSSMGAQIAENIVARDPSWAALYVTLEMPHTAFSARLVSARAGVPLSNLRRGVLNPAQWQNVTAAVAELADRGLYFADSATQTMMSVYSAALERARSLALDGKRLVLLLIDHLGLVKPSAEAVKAKKTREAEVAETSRAQRFIATELGIHVLSMAQIHRDSERQGGDRIPKLYHLRESGSLEQDPNNVLILHRERDRATDQFNYGKPPLLNVAKTRMDEMRMMLLDFDRQRVRFADYTGERDWTGWYGSGD